MFAGLRIAVKHSRVVCVREGARNREHDRQGMLDRQQVEVPEERPEVRAREELHDQVWQAGLGADVEHDDDVWMMQPRCDLSLAEEPVADLFVVREVLVKDLHRHRFAQPHVRGLEHARRRAVSDQPHDLVAANPRASESFASRHERPHAHQTSASSER